MKLLQIFALLSISISAFAGGDPSRKNDSLKTYRFITKNKLAILIDSVFEKDNISVKEIDLLNYYASLLKNTKCDSVRLSDFNLNDLSFYSKFDENMLFPLISLDSIPASMDLIVENEFLGFYNSPFKGVVTSNYGWREGRLHKGIDIDLNKGDKVCAAFDGKVRFSKKQGGFGNVVILMHANGLETVYAHLSKLKVKEGEVVLAGQTIGLGGNTGHSTGSHLHFELRYKGHALNPAAIISFSEHKFYHSKITIRNSKHTLAAFPGNCSIHTVHKGESWNYIASRYGLSTRELMALNGVGKRYYLKPGQQLRVN